MTSWLIQASGKRLRTVLQRADRIREKLGWKPSILNGNGWKPKGMHWNTFERLTAQHDAFAQTALAEVTARLKFTR